jgi:phenylacetate-coenzyme A ligase PaaK-like adenylate-forming protein
MALAAQDTNLQLRLIALLGERCPPALVPHLKQRFGAELKSIYAASEAIVGPQDFAEPETYRWDPQRLHLEVLCDDGTVVEKGSGELLITRRHGYATPLIRHRIGDQVELFPPPQPRVRLLGRIGHAFSLATGVKVSRQLLAGFLDTLPAVVSEADFLVNHGADGRDLLTMTLSIVSGVLEPDGIRAKLAAASLDLADAVGSGHVEIRAQVRAGCLRGKRRLRVTEQPWKL